MTTKTNTMTSGRRRSVTAEPACLLRWVFRRGADVITCAIEAGGRRSYDVCILPHWNLAEAAVEHFEAAASALRRHAEIASWLRQDGWVSQYGTSHHAGVAV